MIEEKQITRLAGEFLKGSDKFLVEVVIKPINHITVYMDGESRVSIEDCQGLSRHLEQMLDRDKEDFDLTISSAGADRPLKLLRQYLKNIGKSLDVVTKSGTKLSGILTRADQAGIELELEVKTGKKVTGKKMQLLTFDEIKTAKEVITFNKIK